MDYVRNKSLEMQLDRVLHPEKWIKLEKWKAKIEKNKLMPEQIKSLRDYNEHHKSMNHKLITRANEITDVLKLFFLRLKKAPEKITEKDLRGYFAKNKYTNAYQEKFHRGVIKRYFKWIYGIEEIGKYPKLVEWIKLPKTTLDNIQKKECLNYEEIKKMITGAKTIRDKCLVAMLYEGGFRAGEILNVRLKDVEINERDAVVKIETSKVKSGASKRFREVLMVESYYYLQMWMREHPRKDNPEAFLFYNYNHKTENKQLGYSGFYFIITDLAKKSGIKKKYNPHWFRHSSVKNSEKELSDSELRVRFGWEKGSPIIARYSGISSEDVIEKERRLRGLTPEKEKKSNKPLFKECPRCLQSNNLTITQYCSRCGASLSISSANKIRQVDKLTKEIGGMIIKNPTKPRGQIIDEYVDKLIEKKLQEKMSKL